MLTRITMVAAATVLLAACGSSQTDRAMSGGAIGAGVGGAASAATGGNLLGGAILGGAAGAGTGALTDEDDVNLGDPIWGGDDDDDNDNDN